MAKSAGLAHKLLIDGFDISGDIAAVNSISSPLNPQQVNGIDQLGVARIGLLHDGAGEFSTYWNPSSGGAGTSLHEILKTLPTTDRTVTYLAGQTLGAPACSIVSKQINYDWSRGQDGSMTGTTSVAGNAYGLAWGVNLTAGKRTEAAAGNGPGVDLGAVPISYSFGWSMYLHVMGTFTGTSITVKVQDSADNATFADITGATFAAATGSGTNATATQRVQSASSTATVRRYVRVVSSGTFTAATYTVNFIRNEAIAS